MGGPIGLSDVDVVCIEEVSEGLKQRSQANAREVVIRFPAGWVHFLSGRPSSNRADGVLYAERRTPFSLRSPSRSPRATASRPSPNLRIFLDSLDQVDAARKAMMAG